VLDARRAYFLEDISKKFDIHCEFSRLMHFSPHFEQIVSGIFESLTQIVTQYTQVGKVAQSRLSALYFTLITALRMLGCFTQSRRIPKNKGEIKSSHVQLFLIEIEQQSRLIAFVRLSIPSIIAICSAMNCDFFLPRPRSSSLVSIL
jgi:hypothetical protein